MMDKVKFNNYLYAGILIAMVIFVIILTYIVFLLTTDGAQCMLQPIEYAREQGLNVIELRSPYGP